MGIGIGAMGQQEFDECAITRARRRMKSASSIRVQLRPCWIRAAFKKQASNVIMSELNRCRQRPAAIRTGYSDLVWIFVEDCLDAIEISECRSHGEIIRGAAFEKQPGGSGVARLMSIISPPAPEPVPKGSTEDSPKRRPRPSSKTTPQSNIDGLNIDWGTSRR
jgi:hypothetical protein